MIGVQVKKKTLAYSTDCIQNSKPIDLAWNYWNLMAVGGACMAALISHGPSTQMGQERGDEPEEHGEASEELHRQGVLDACEWICERTFDVVDDKYDDKFEEHHAVALVTNDDGTKTIHPVFGVKGYSDTRA